MKRISIALAVLGLSAGALAALPATTDPTLVAVPQLPGGFVIGLTAYYLEPSFTRGDLDYASVNLGTTEPFHSFVFNNEPGYDWGWGINIGYIFPNTGNDVNLNYIHFGNSKSGSVAIPPDVGDIVPLFIDPSITAFTIRAALSRAEYDLNQIDFTAGQFIDVSCRLILHPNIGLRWASVQRKLNDFYYAPTTTATSPSGFAVITEDSDFSGIGPLLGVDASYYLGMGFGAVAHFDSALLIGNIDSSAKSIMVPGGAGIIGPIPFLAFLNIDNKQRIVPVTDEKLGLDYTYMFNNAANSDLTLEVGWQVSHYFNAIDRMVAVTAIDGSSIIGHRTSDFGISGPYVSLVLHI